MLRNPYYLTLRANKLLEVCPLISKEDNLILKNHKRNLTERKRWPKFRAPVSDSNSLTTVNHREIFEKEFPEYFTDGKFITRISYVDFIDQALEKLKELGLEKDLKSYKELLKVFPPGKYHPKSRLDLGMFHAPQQLCAIRVLFQMESNLLKPDREVEQLVIDAFSKYSDVWRKCARMIYWTMKSRNMDPHPLPEVIPTKTHELAKVSLTRMIDDPKALLIVKNTSSLPDCVDKTWITYTQSPNQQSIISKLTKKDILYIEEYGLTYVNEKFLSYFVLKLYDSEENIKARSKEIEPDYNYNTLKMKFYGKPIKEKLLELQSINQVGDGYILGIAITGTSSHDSVLSWLKLLQQRNPNLKNINVVFRLKRTVTEIVNPSADGNVENISSRQ